MVNMVAAFSRPISFFFFLTKETVFWQNVSIVDDNLRVFRLD